MKQYNSSIRGKLFKYFEQRLRIKRSTKGWWRCICFWCGGQFTMGIHLESIKVHCFKCLEESTPIKLLCDIEVFETNQEAYSFLQIQQEYDAYDRMVTHTPKVETIPLELPESFTLISQGDSLMGKAARHYMHKRGFNIDKISLQGIGYCTSGEYAGYIIFPYYRKGKLVYFQGRLYMGRGPKMKNPPEEVYGVGKSQLIYNEDALFIYNKIYIMESITNCLTMGDHGIGLSGKKISSYQLSRIIQSPCEKSILILDPDAFEEAIDLSLKLVHYKNVKLVKLPDEMEIRGRIKENPDVNDIGKNKVLAFINNTPYQKYMELYKLKLNLHGKTAILTHTRIRPNYSSSRGAA